MATWATPKTTHTVEDQVTPDIFNRLAENEIYLNETKIVSSQVQDGAVTSTEATTRANIASGDTVKVAFGKLRKWFSDFGVIAFLDQVDTDQIAPTSVTMGKIASNAVSTGKLDGLAVTTAKMMTAVQLIFSPPKRRSVNFLSILLLSSDIKPPDRQAGTAPSHFNICRKKRDCLQSGCL